MSKKTEEKAKDEGYTAYEKGKDESANPYPASSDEHLSWNDGYNEAADENE